jgi:hypothetical protein
MTMQQLSNYRVRFHRDNEPENSAAGGTKTGDVQTLSHILESMDRKNVD